MSQINKTQKNKISKSFLKKLSTILKKHVREIKKKDKLLNKKIKENNRLYNKALINFRSLFKSINSDRSLNKIYNIKKIRTKKIINNIDINNDNINFKDINNEINENIIYNDIAIEINENNNNTSYDLIPDEKLNYSINEDDNKDNNNDYKNLLYPNTFNNKNELLEGLNKIDNNLDYFIFAQDTGFKSCKKYFISENCDILENNNYLYEIIDTSLYKTKKYYKLYFDIESEDINIVEKTDKQKYKIIYSFINVISHFICDNKKLFFNNEISNKDLMKCINDEILIFKSENQNIKFSYHIIFNNITFEDNKIILHKFINSLLEYDDYKYLFNKIRINDNISINLPDCSVYKSFQAFRCLNQSKYNKNNILNLTNNKDNSIEYLDDSLVLTNNKGLLHNDNIYTEEIINNIINTNKEILNNEHPEFKNIIKESLMSLDKSYYEDYNLWSRTLNILRNYKIDYYDIFRDFSKQSKKHSDKECYNL